MVRHRNLAGLARERLGAKMTVEELRRILRAVPKGQGVIVTGRRQTTVACSIPTDAKVPKGWRRVNQVNAYADLDAGQQRIIIGELKP